MEKIKKEIGVAKRLAFVRGQIDGLIKMINEEKDCLDILNQLKAAKSGLEKAGALLGKEYFLKCFSKNEKKSEEKIEKIFSEILKF